MTDPDNRVDEPAADASGEPASLGEFRGAEIYPMPAFVTLAVADVAGVAAWYERALGFTTVFRVPTPAGVPPPLVHLRRRKYQDVLIVPGAEGLSAGSSLTVSFSADGEIDELAARARAAAPFGRSAIDGPVDTPWNTRDLRVTDPAGHRLVFTGRQAHPDPEQAARWKKMFDEAR